VQIRRDGNTERVEGKVLVQAVDGGLLLLSPDGQLWMIQPGEIVDRSQDERPFHPLTQDEISTQLLQELPGYRIHKTQHYIICYNTSDVYAEWCGALYERLYRGFFNFWKTRGWELQDPEMPLVALVFANRASFAEYSRPELGEAVNSVIGYYNMRTNRVNMYDLTGVDEFRKFAPRVNSTAHINQILSQPGAERTVATIVHEATHQLAYNSGMQVRFADNPLWVSEGLAMFFEAPDYKNEKGWRSIGMVNMVHLVNYRQYLAQRPQDSLRTLLADDKRFHEGDQVGTAYSEAWALNYFLLNRHRNDYVTYLKRLAEQKPLLQNAPEQRVALFQDVFGDLTELDQELVRFYQRLR
jgi:hypothetical protein